MPKRSKKRRGKESKLNLKDVTLADAANSIIPIRAVRAKKMTGKTLKEQVEQGDFPGKEAGDGDVIDDWFEKNLSDFDDEPSDIEDVESSVKTRRGRKGKVACRQDEDEVQPDSRVAYPADMWFILSNFITPEDVGRFCLLCRDALNVVNTASFWRKLYKRHFSVDANLPVNLQPDAIEGAYGIRAKVITSLYQMYPLFQARNKMSVMSSDDNSSSSILGSVCLYTWTQGRVGSHFYHFFKFRHTKGIQDQNIRNRLMATPTIWANSSEGESVLKVLCPYFQHFPLENIMGLYLVNLSVNVSRDMCYNRLKLEFQHYLTTKGKPSKSNKVTIVLDPVITVNVINWWHPQFNESMIQITNGSGNQNGVSNHWDGD